MEELRVYGHYYKLFKGEGGIPREVTVIAIDGDMVTLSTDIIQKKNWMDVQCQLKCVATKIKS